MGRAFPMLCLAAFWAVVSPGCTGGPDWPAEPAEITGTLANPTAVVWTPEADDGPRYLQACRDGVKRALYIESGESDQFELMADLDEIDVKTLRYVFILLDGVPYRLIREMYEAGRFRLFFPPSKMIGAFPSLTDIGFGNMFGVSGSSCYESVIFNRQSNQLHSGTSVYLSGDNELWASRLDYRQTLWVDGVSYVLPRYAARREFAAMFKRADEVLTDHPERRDVLIYTLSTDAACHILGADKTRTLLAELDRYIERLVYDHPGEIGVVLLSDHGNNLAPKCRRADIDAAVRAAGLIPVFNRGFKHDHEVIIPRYGLISFVRAFCRDSEDQGALINALGGAEGVEHVMWMQGMHARVARGDEVASIGFRARTDEGGTEEFFSYPPTEGDPLDLLAILDGLQPHRFAATEAPFYSAADLLTATADHPFPDPLWRIWHGLSDHTAVAPDVAASLKPGWYYGEKGLDMFAELNGTHGGLRQSDAATIFMTTMFTPPPVMRTTDVIGVINKHFPWRPRTADPATSGLHKYLSGQ